LYALCILHVQTHSGRARFESKFRTNCAPLNRSASSSSEDQHRHAVLGPPASSSYPMLKGLGCSSLLVCSSRSLSKKFRVMASKSSIIASLQGHRVPRWLLACACSTTCSIIASSPHCLRM
jgi:hypothetical protein